MQARRGDEPTRDAAGAGPGNAKLCRAIVAAGFDWAAAVNSKANGWVVSYGFHGTARSLSFTAKSLDAAMRRIERGEL